MIVPLITLGKTLSKDSNENDSIIDKLIETIPVTKKNKEGVIVEISFDTLARPQTVSFKTKKINESLNLTVIAKEYLWVGNSKANSKQWALTTTAPAMHYILSDSLEVLKNKLSEKSPLRQKIEGILTTFYKNEVVNDGKTRLVLDFDKISEINVTKPNFASKERKFKACMEDVSKQIVSKIVDKNQDIILLSVMENNRLLCKDLEYIELIKKEKLNTNNNNFLGICSICGKEALVSFEDTKKIEFKYFITDKISFSSEISEKGFAKNMVLCHDCLEKWLLGEKYLKNKMKTRIGDFPAYVIPYSPNHLSETNDFDRMSGILMNRFETIMNYKSLKELENKLKESEKGSYENYSLTILFTKPKKGGASSEFKVSGVLEEIPQNRINGIAKNLRDSANKINYLFEPDNDLTLNLSKVYSYIQPVYGKSNLTERKKSLDFIISLIKEEIPRDLKIVRKMLERLRGIYLGDNFNYFVFCRIIMEMNILNLFLKMEMMSEKELRSVEMSEIDRKDRILEEDRYDYAIKKGIEFVQVEMYSDVQKGLFWLGFETGRLMTAQFKKLGKQPVLDKINFKGMNKKSLVRYVNELTESMKNYDMLGFPKDQLILYLAHKNLDGYLNSKDVENMNNEVPFYILSGISFEYYSRPKKLEPKEENTEMMKIE